MVCWLFGLGLSTSYSLVAWSILPSCLGWLLGFSVSLAHFLLCDLLNSFEPNATTVRLCRRFGLSEN